MRKLFFLIVLFLVCGCAVPHREAPQIKFHEAGFIVCRIIAIDEQLFIDSGQLVPGVVTIEPVSPVLADVSSIKIRFKDLPVDFRLARAGMKALIDFRNCERRPPQERIAWVFIDEGTLPISIWK